MNFKPQALWALVKSCNKRLCEAHAFYMGLICGYCQLETDPDRLIRGCPLLMTRGNCLIDEKKMARD